MTVWHTAITCWAEYLSGNKGYLCLKETGSNLVRWADIPQFLDIPPRHPVQTQTSPRCSKYQGLFHIEQSDVSVKLASHIQSVPKAKMSANFISRSLMCPRDTIFSFLGTMSVGAHRQV
jgi:hypothetical protein